MYGVQNPEPENIPYQVLRTKSSGSLNRPPNPQAPLPNPLSKAKSSTYISPQQSETLMYNTKVTLTLRRSQSRLDTDLKKNYEDGKETLKRVHRNNSFHVDHKSDQSEENKIDGRVREGFSPSQTTHKHINRYYFGETPDFSEPIYSQYTQPVTLAKKQSTESLNGPPGHQGYYHVPEVRNGAPRPPPLSSKPHLQQTVCSHLTHSKLHNKACYTNLAREYLTLTQTPV